MGCSRFFIILAYLGVLTSCNEKAPESKQEKPPVAVEAAPIERGEITLRRTFSGSLEAASEFTLSPKIGGRVQRVHFDLGDIIQRGQVAVELDDDEARQQVVQAEAELAVANANLAEAQSALEIAQREHDRVDTLRKRGIASDTRFDEVLALSQSAGAKREIAGAQVKRAEAALQGAKIRLGYTQVKADWSEGDDTRVVAERLVNEGATVSANTPLMSIVELDPLIGVIYVPEREYARMKVGQPVTIASDERPGELFDAEVCRIAPVFRPGSRQARVELLLANPQQRLKPGSFIRATVTMETVQDALIVPLSALTSRDDTDGVFVVSADGKKVAWSKVQVGIREGERAQIFGDGLAGKVITLGQQLLDDGSAVTVVEARTAE